MREEKRKEGGREHKPGYDNRVNPHFGVVSQGKMEKPQSITERESEAKFREVYSND